MLLLTLAVVSILLAINLRTNERLRETTDRERRAKEQLGDEVLEVISTGLGRGGESCNGVAHRRR